MEVEKENQPEIPNQPEVADSKPQKPMADQLNVGFKGNNNMQKNFERFRKKRAEKLKMQKILTTKNNNIDRKNPEFKQKLRQKFIETAKKYYGVPYHRKYHTDPSSPYHNAPLFLDCCGLTRQVCRDLKDDLGFEIDVWNQAYQFDTLPIVLKEEEMQPGDLVFYSAIYNNPKTKKQKHNMVHVEIFIGGETGEQSIGSRWQRGTIKLFDSYKFESKNYHSIEYHYRSIDTWLEGICRSHCPDHPWQSSKLTWAPGKNSIFNTDVDEDDLNAPDLEEEEGPEGEEHKGSDMFFVGPGNNNKLIKDAMKTRGYKQMDPGAKFNYDFRLRWVQTLDEVNFAKVVEGKHLINHLPNIWSFTSKTTTLETVENVKCALASGVLKSNLKVEDFWPETYRLDSVPDLSKFLNTENSGNWILKKAYSNCGRGITLVSDIEKYKEEIKTEQEKLEQDDTPDSNDIFLQKMKEAGIESEEPAADSKKTKSLGKIAKEMGKSVIQRYMENPLLYNGKKFDFRCYMFVASMNPFICFFNEGYVRLSLNDYSMDDFGTKDGKITHLTNNSVQKKHPDYKQMKADSILTVKQLCKDLQAAGKIEDADAFQTSIQEQMKEIM